MTNEILESMTQKDKYVAFRNFMTNELGIGKEDIKLWVQESTEREIAKLIGQMNFTELVQSAINKTVRSLITDSSRNSMLYEKDLFSRQEIERMVREEIGKAVLKTFDFTKK